MSLITAIVDGPGLVNPKVGVWSTFYIIPSEPINPDQLEIEIFGPSPQAQLSRNSDGSFDVNWCCSDPGEYEIEICIDEIDIIGSPFSVNVEENDNENISSGGLSITSEETIFGPGIHGKRLDPGTSSLTLIPKDSNGNFLKMNPSEVFVAFDGPEFLIGNVSLNKDGSLCVTWSHSEPGEYNMNITYGGSNSPLYSPITLVSGSDEGFIFDQDSSLANLVSNLAEMQNRLEQLKEERKQLQTPSLTQEPNHPQTLQHAESLPNFRQPVTNHPAPPSDSSQSLSNLRKPPDGIGFAHSTPTIATPMSTVGLDSRSDTISRGTNPKVTDKVTVKIYLNDETFKTFAVTPNDTVASFKSQISKKIKIAEKDLDKYAIFSKQNHVKREELDENEKMYTLQLQRGWTKNHRFIFQKKKKEVLALIWLRMFFFLLSTDFVDWCRLSLE